MLVDASAGVQVGTELAWQYLRTKHIPTIILINKMDKENVKFEDVLNQVRKKLGHKAVPFCWPLGKSDKFDGFANVIDKKLLFLLVKN